MKVKINQHLFPIKSHYFLFWGALSGSMPFLLLIAKGLGFSATSAAVLTSVYPFIPLIAKPVFGTLADHFKHIKAFVIATLIFVNIFLLAIVFIPPITRVVVLPYSVLLCSSQGFEIGMPLDTSESCSSDLTSKDGLNISGSCYTCNQPTHYLAQDYSNISAADLNCSSEPIPMLFHLDRYSKISENIWFPVKYLEVMNESNVCSGDTEFYSCHLEYDFKSKDQCQTESNWFVYSTFQFWLFVIFFICCRTGMSVLISLSDAVCFQMLEGRFDLYGRQRMWGAIGWGLFSLLSAYLLTFSSHDDFSPSVYMTVVLLLLDALVISKASVELIEPSGRILKDLGILVKNLRVLIFLFNVFCMGFLTGILWNYYFWFLYTLEASKLLLSLILVVQCFFGELPSFFMAGKVVEKIGFQNSLSISFLAFGIRFLVYSFIVNPWYVLPAELCQGPTFGLFYSTMAMYAKSVALPGTEASMQGLVGGTFEGLGGAVGGLVAGIAMDQVGGHLMFRYASILAFTCGLLHFCSHLAFKHFGKVESQDALVSEYSQDPALIPSISDVRRSVQENGEESNFL